MQTVSEVSRRAGVSVRTLRYYDRIGLLKPAKITAAGYRLYDDTAITRLQSILLFRELRFSLREIREMLDSPNFDAAAALEQQIRLLELEQQRIARLIALAKEMQEKGEHDMGFEGFDTQELDAYREEVKARWGQTEAYRESETRTPKSDDAAQLMNFFARFGTMRHLEPDGDCVQELVAALQQFITGHFYRCTKEILRGLGAMYTQDDRFRSNIDRAGGEGTADFASRAIAEYCK